MSLRRETEPTFEQYAKQWLEINSEQMGHASIQITADTYVHLLPGRNVGWVDKLDNLCAPQQSATPAQQEIEVDRKSL